MLRVFGPVPSRRLGRSLGINNIPAKTCSYSCIYCQIGRTIKMSIKRERFYDPDEIMTEVEERLKHLKERNERIDYITFIPDGEPTLDTNLGKLAEEMKNTGIKIAILTNSSLLWMEDVKRELPIFDLVSLKIDALDSKTWRKINRPHPDLNLEKIKKGIVKFADEFKGELITETMLIKNCNDERENIEKIADFLREIKPRKAYLSIPTRPPAEKNVSGADREKLVLAHQIFRENGIDVEFLTGFEGYDFSLYGEIEREILSIASVHPIREDILSNILTKHGVSWEIVDKLIREGKLKRDKYRGKFFYRAFIS